MAVESVAMTLTELTGDVRMLTITWSCATGAATIVATDTNSKISAQLFGWWAFMAVIDPGATAPTDNYDFILNDSAGAKVFGTALDACDTANSETFLPLLAGTAGADGHYGSRFISTALTFDITNNSNNAANGIGYIYFSRRK